MTTKNREQAITKLAKRWRAARDDWRVAWPRAVLTGRRQNHPFLGRRPEFTKEYQEARKKAESSVRELENVVGELLPEFRREGLDVLALRKLLRALNFTVGVMALGNFCGTMMRTEVADRVDDVDLLVPELVARNVASERGEAPPGPRRLTELDRRTIQVLKNVGRPVKLNDLVRMVNPDIELESFRRRLWVLGEEGEVGRDHKGRNWHPSAGKTEK